MYSQRREAASSTSTNRSAPSRSTLICGTASSPRRHAPLHQLWRRRIPGSSSSTAPDHLHQHRPWSSSPTTIYINKLHHVAAITTHGQRQTPTRSPSPTSNAAQLQAENPGLIPDIFYQYNSIAIDNYHFIFVHHDLATRVAVYFYLHKFSPCSYFVCSDMVDNFFAPTIYGDLLCYLYRLWRAWLMMVPIFARPVLATPMRAFVPDTLLSLANSALRIELLRLLPHLPQVLQQLQILR
jgi:hypothetical protein